MKNMKKLLAVMMVLVMTLALAACGDTKKDDGSAAGSADAPKAVSYTHLDVYKRQALSSSTTGPSSNLCRWFMKNSI